MNGINRSPRDVPLPIPSPQRRRTRQYPPHSAGSELGFYKPKYLRPSIKLVAQWFSRALRCVRAPHDRDSRVPYQRPETSADLYNRAVVLAREPSLLYAPSVIDGMSNPLWNTSFQATSFGVLLLGAVCVSLRVPGPTSVMLTPTAHS